jgi:hypothetical protein
MIYTIKTHKAITIGDAIVVVAWHSSSTPFARTEYLTVSDAIEALKQYDPDAAYIDEAITKFTNQYFILYVGVKGTYQIEQHNEGPYSHTGGIQ